MSNGREFAGWACVVLGFAVIVMLGYGVLDPIGMPAGATSMGALLVGLLPSVALALVVFAIGLWLLKGKR
ncbi:MAG TPA: hypothetical protein VGD21_08860 [Lysobacter sp.]